MTILPIKTCQYLWFLTFLVFFISGCHETYHPEKVVDSIKEICQKEYNINNVEVKLVGKTLGVHLPLQQLFSSDFEHVLATGKVQNLESLLQFSPEAMDKVEDVLFSTVPLRFRLPKVLLKKPWFYNLFFHVKCLL